MVAVLTKPVRGARGCLRALDGERSGGPPRRQNDRVAARLGMTAEMAGGL